MDRLKKILIHFTERNKRLRIMCLEYMSNRKFDSKKELELDILLLVHSLEKGMSFNNPKVDLDKKRLDVLKISLFYGTRTNMMLKNTRLKKVFLV